MVFTWIDKLTSIVDLVPDEADRMALTYAIVRYGSSGEEPDLPYPLNALFESVRGDLDYSRRAHENGAKGGRPKKKPQAEEVPVETETSSGGSQEEVTEKGETSTEKGYGNSENPSTEEVSEVSGNSENLKVKDKVRVRVRDRDILDFPDGDSGATEKIPYDEIVSMLNEATGKAFRPSTPKTRAAIRARWSEGFRLPDFKAVIEGQTAKWRGDAQMEQYLRPETLFGTKFEGYLNAAPKARPEPSPPSRSSPEDELAAWDAAHADWLAGGGIERARAVRPGTTTLTSREFHDVSLKAERDSLALQVPGGGKEG